MSGKHTKKDGKSQFSMGEYGKSPFYSWVNQRTFDWAIFQFAMWQITRGYMLPDFFGSQNRQHLQHLQSLSRAVSACLCRYGPGNGNHCWVWVVATISYWNLAELRMLQQGNISGDAHHQSPIPIPNKFLWNGAIKSQKLFFSGDAIGIVFVSVCFSYLSFYHLYHLTSSYIILSY